MLGHGANNGRSRISPLVFIKEVEAEHLLETVSGCAVCAARVREWSFYFEGCRIGIRGRLRIEVFQ